MEMKTSTVVIDEIDAHVAGSGIPSVPEPDSNRGERGRGRGVVLADREFERGHRHPVAIVFERGDPELDSAVARSGARPHALGEALERPDRRIDGGKPLR